MDLQKKLQSNIWKYAVMLITNKRVFVAILGAYYLTVPEVTAQTIGLILLVGNLAGFLFEIPSGYISDKIGHKHALVMSRTLMILSTLFFLLAEDVIFLVLGSALMSVSHAFCSGTGSAFMHETLEALGREKEYVTVMGKISSIGFAVPIAFMVLVPFLVEVDYKTPFLIALALDVLGLLVTLTLTKPPVTPRHIEEVGVTNFRGVMKEGYRLNYFSLALFSGIIGGTLFAVGGFRAPYQVFLEIPVIWFGVLYGIGRVGASLLLAYSGNIIKGITLLSFYRFELILYSVLILILGTISVWWVAASAFIVMNAFRWGLSKIDEGYQLERIRSSRFKATLLSAGSQIEVMITAVLSAGVGFMIARTSYQLGFLSLGIIFVIVLCSLYLYIARRHTAGAYGSI